MILAVMQLVLKRKFLGLILRARSKLVHILLSRIIHLLFNLQIMEPKRRARTGLVGTLGEDKGGRELNLQQFQH